MKNIRFFSAIILCFALGLSISFGQVSFKSGFVIKQNNDTIYGEIQDLNEREKALKCVFKSNGEENEFSPGDIKGYKITDGNLYESHLVTIDDEERTIFLLALVFEPMLPTVI